MLVCIGAVLIATFGAISEPAHSLDQLLELLNRRPFILWMVSTGVVIVLVLAASRIIKVLSSPNHSRFALVLKRHGPLLAVPKARLLRGLSFAFVSGVLSAHTLLLAKSAVELVVRTIIDHVNQFNRWQSWLILIGMICLALTQLYYTHRGLKLCSTSISYPFVFCVYNIVAILDGLIYFHQASQLAGLHAGLIALGTVVLLGGVLCLSWRLEDIDSHAGVTLPSATQAPLGPGMGVIDEPPVRGLDGDALLEDYDHGDGDYDEEMQASERQPLLSAGGRRGSAHQRVPSVPLVSPYRSRARTLSAQLQKRPLDPESAQIWAELDDDSEAEPGAGTSKSSSARAHGSWRQPRASSFHYHNSRPLSSPTPSQPHPDSTTTGTLARVRSGTGTPSSPLKSGSGGSPRRPRIRRNDPLVTRRTSAPVSAAVGGSDHIPPNQPAAAAATTTPLFRHTFFQFRQPRNYGATTTTTTTTTAHDAQAPPSPIPEQDSSRRFFSFSGRLRRSLPLLRRWTAGRES